MVIQVGLLGLLYSWLIGMEVAYNDGVMEKNPLELLFDVCGDVLNYHPSPMLKRALAKAKAFTPTVVVSIEGGCFTGGGSNYPVTVIVRDFDSIGKQCIGDECNVLLENGDYLPGIVRSIGADTYSVEVSGVNTVVMSSEAFTDAQDPLSGQTCEAAGYTHTF